MPPHDVFISFSSKDQAKVKKIVPYLEEREVKCWVSYRDSHGTFALEIDSAIKSCKAILLIMSSSSRDSKNVIREMGTADEFNIPIIPFRLEPVSFYYTRDVTYVDGFPSPFEDHLAELYQRVLKTLGREYEPHYDWAHERYSFWDALKENLARLLPNWARLVRGLLITTFAVMLLLGIFFIWRYKFPSLSPEFTAKPGDLEGLFLSDLSSFKNPNAQWHFIQGRFSMICRDSGTKINPTVFRKFITALWSVYFSEEAPGVFMEPLPGKRFLVHYNGNVINNDLGRVMRESDLHLKKLTAGLEKPNIPGFDPSTFLRTGSANDPQEASRLFWLLPENMRYKRSPEVLLFEGGKFSIKPGEGFQSQRVTVREEDKALAQSLTSFFPQLADKYQVFQELCDYARMIGLARYLKESEVPLFGFLMANKHLVLTEDSPEMLDNLSESLQKFKDIRPAGGINMSFTMHFEEDPQNLKAVSAAWKAQLPGSPGLGSRLTGIFPSIPFPCVIDKKRYTVLPASLAPRSPPKIAFTTDLALKQGKRPSLEMVRYYDPTRSGYGEFGLSQYLYLPYRIKPEGEDQTPLLNVLVPERMALINLVSGEKEILIFQREPRVGYFPPKNSGSSIIGLFVRTDATYRMLDKLGNEYYFDEEGLLTDLNLPGEYRFHVDYLENFTRNVESVPYRLTPDGEEKINHQKTPIPRRMRVIDQRQRETEVLIFRDQGNNAGYFPQEEGSSKFRKLMIRSRPPFILIDKQANVFLFDSGGRFIAMRPGNAPPLVQKLSLDQMKLSFSYTFGKMGKIFVSKVFLADERRGGKPVCVVSYEYDADGKLIRITGPEGHKGI
jgi:hypothetical protein